jgi:hypothetical protein
VIQDLDSKLEARLGKRTLHTEAEIAAVPPIAYREIVVLDQDYFQQGAGSQGRHC